MIHPYALIWLSVGCIHIAAFLYIVIRRKKLIKTFKNSSLENKISVTVLYVGSVVILFINILFFASLVLLFFSLLLLKTPFSPISTPKTKSDKTSKLKIGVFEEFLKSHNAKGSGKKVDPYIVDNTYMFSDKQLIQISGSHVYVKFITCKFNWVQFKKCQNIIIEDCRFKDLKVKHSSDFSVTNSRIRSLSIYSSVHLDIETCNMSWFTLNTSFLNSIKDSKVRDFTIKNSPDNIIEVKGVSEEQIRKGERFPAYVFVLIYSILACVIILSTLFFLIPLVSDIYFIIAIWIFGPLLLGYASYSIIFTIISMKRLRKKVKLYYNVKKKLYRNLKKQIGGGLLVLCGLVFIDVLFALEITFYYVWVIGEVRELLFIAFLILISGIISLGVNFVILSNPLQIERIKTKQNPLYPHYNPIFSFFIPLFTLIWFGLKLNILQDMIYLLISILILGSCVLYISLYASRHKLKRFSREQEQKNEEIPSRFRWVIGTTTATIGIVLILVFFNLVEELTLTLRINFILVMVIMLIGLGFFIIGINPLFNTVSKKKIFSINKDEDIEQLQQLAKESPMDSSNWNRLGISYFFTNQYEKALGAFKKALEINPKSKYALNGIGLVHSRQGNYNAAIENFEKALQRKSPVGDMTPLYKMFGVENMGRMVTIAEDDEINLNLARVYYEKGDYEKAKEVCVQGIRFKYHTKELWDLLGDIYRKLEEYDRCIEVFTNMIEKYPKYENIAYNIGLAYSQKGNLVKAVEFFEISLGMKTKENPATRDLAKAYFDLKQYKNALRACKQSLKYFPEDLDIIRLSKKIYNAMGKKK
ncbi:MAG: tetratricopeptide repeat protein [Candidatus Thorarchaeota archaeon]